MPLDNLPATHTMTPPGLWRPVASTRTEILEECDISVSLLPVSYTHLDVYKRQSCMFTYHRELGLNLVLANTVPSHSLQANLVSTLLLLKPQKWQ